MIPSLYLRLADEDEIIGTDWAEMGERAYAYLPFDEELQTSSRSSNEEPNVVVDSRSQCSRNKSPRLTKLKKMLMADKNTVIRGVPDLIERPVLDYNQQKDLGAYQLHTFDRPTGGDLLQKPPSKIREEHRENQSVDIDHHPMSYSTEETSTPGSSMDSSEKTKG